MDELLQKHRTFTLSVAVGGFVFLLALLLRGCAVYNRDLSQARASVLHKAAELTKEPVPDGKYLAEMDRVVAAADQRVAELSRQVGRVAKGEALWEECIADVLREIGQDSPEKRKDIMERARRLPSAAFSLLLEEARTVLLARAGAAGVDVAPQSQDLGFELVREEGFARSLAGLAAVSRVLARAIDLGVQRIEGVAVAGATQGVGGTEDDPFLRSIVVRFKMRGSPAVLAEVVKSVNDDDARGRRLVLDEVHGLGRPIAIKAGEPGNLEFGVRVLLVNLEAKEEVGP